MSLEDLKKEYEIKCNFCDALLLQFKKPIRYDLTIPNGYHIYNLFVVADKIMKGGRINKKGIYLMQHDFEYISEKSFPHLSKKVSKGLIDVLRDSRRETSFLQDYMERRKDIFGRDWFFGYGDLFRFRDGEREKAELRVSNTFSKEELAEFNKIGEIIQPYIKYVHSTTKD